MSDAALRIFPDEFVPSIQASDGYKRWAKSSPGDLARWTAFRDALLAGQTPPVPVMSTKLGQALVAAGKEHMSISYLAGQVTNPYPPTPPPPSPLTPSGPITISAGGTYTGWWRSTQTGVAAVTIATAAPVLIQDSIIESTSTSPSDLVAGNPVGAQVTWRRCTFNGEAGNYGRALNPESYTSYTIENCTLNRTGGIYFQTPQTGASIYVAKNRHLNVQGTDTVLRQFVQFNNVQNTTSLIVEWNEVLNTYGQSRVEDCISAFGGSSDAIIRNNFVRGGYATVYTFRHSGVGIIVGDNGGNNNTIHDNQIVAFDGGIGISGGANNHAYNNRIVTDGRLDNGTATIPNQGLICYVTTPGNNNTLYSNYVGACQSSAFPNWSNTLVRTLGYTPTADNNVAADNTLAYGNLTTPMVKADEDAEWTIWQAKLTSNGITIGA